MSYPSAHSTAVVCDPQKLWIPQHELQSFHSGSYQKELEAHVKALEGQGRSSLTQGEIFFVRPNDVFYARVLFGAESSAEGVATQSEVWANLKASIGERFPLRTPAMESHLSLGALIFHMCKKSGLGVQLESVLSQATHSCSSVLAFACDPHASHQVESSGVAFLRLGTVIRPKMLRMGYLLSLTF